MHLELFQRDCVSCPSQPPVCTCAADQSCIQISQSCNACATFTCQPNSASNDGKGGGISSGALAGAIVAVLLILVGALVVFFMYRRQRARLARKAVTEAKSDTPAPAEAVLNRPDPTEKPPSTPTTASQTNTVRVFPSTGDNVIDLDPRSRGSTTASSSRASGSLSVGNPFDDGHSIQTASTGTTGTNVIPIALVPPGSVHPPSLHSENSERSTLPPGSPIRPDRPTDLGLDDSQSSRNTLRTPSPKYAQSQRSGSSRGSYMSNASYSSDFLEAPMIVTQTQGAVRQVVGKVKAEVIQTSGTVTPTSHLSTDSLQPSPGISRPSIRSPLAATSFGPSDIVDEVDEEHELSARSDPFGDNHASSKPPSVISNVSQAASELDGPVLPWAKHGNSPRPESISTNAGSVIDIGSATRVNVGLLRANSRTTMARLVSPSTLSPNSNDTLQEQQQRALAHAEAQARAQGLDKPKRISGTSVVSTTSTRADSILESFPFVPPSPISSRPVRSPPRSPLGQQFSGTPQPSATSTTTGPASSSPLPSDIKPSESSLSPLTPPPSRRTLGMSTGSQLSTASSGLGSFPFQIDHGTTEGLQPSSTSQLRQRASLDTLALMTDLTSYPLGYDRDDHGSLRSVSKN